MVNQTINAELKYNPYLRSTVVRFNRKAPRINSRVEKYQESILSDWVQEMPSIFHDEMNGFDFELEFTGTEMDCDEVRVAFENEGVSEKQVRVFHKAVYEDRNKKIERIKVLFKWLEDTPNDNFDVESFRRMISELNNGSCQLVLFGFEKGEQSSSDLPGISLEVIGNLSELDNTDLYHTPIVIKVNKEDLPTMQYTFDYFAQRYDVSEKQIFFTLAPGLKQEDVMRTIQDLGVNDPRFIFSLGDNRIKKYILSYPLTDYIVEVHKCLSEVLCKLKHQLLAENEESERANSEIHERLHQLMDDVVKMKDADDAVVYRDNLDMPAGFKNALDELYSSIEMWRRKKTQITTESDADISATEFTGVVFKAFNEYVDKINKATAYIRNEIDLALRNAYGKANADLEFSTDYILLRQKPEIEIPLGRKEFLNIKEEKYVTPKESGFLFRQTVEKEPILETVYYTQQWREYAASIICPLAEEYAKDRFDALCEYNDNMTATYHSHLQSLIDEKNMHREEIAKLLSNEERQLEADNKWMVAFAEQVEDLGRR